MGYADIKRASNQLVANVTPSPQSVQAGATAQPQTVDSSTTDQMTTVALGVVVVQTAPVWAPIAALGGVLTLTGCGTFFDDDDPEETAHDEVMCRTPAGDVCIPQDLMRLSAPVLEGMTNSATNTRRVVALDAEQYANEKKCIEDKFVLSRDTVDAMDDATLGCAGQVGAALTECRATQSADKFEYLAREKIGTACGVSLLATTLGPGDAVAVQGRWTGSVAVLSSATNNEAPTKLSEASIEPDAVSEIYCLGDEDEDGPGHIDDGAISFTLTWGDKDYVTEPNAEECPAGTTEE